MNIVLGIVIALSAMSLYCESVTAKSPIKMCTKSDFSLCVDLPFPNGCVNLNNVTTNNTGKGSIKLLHSVQCVVVTDVESTEEKCIVLFDSFYCQGNGLVLNGNVRPAFSLHNYGFANRAVSYRHCSPRLYAQLSDKPSNSYWNTGNEIVKNGIELNEDESNDVESDRAEPNEAVQNDYEPNEAVQNDSEPNEAESNEAKSNEDVPNEDMPNEDESNDAMPNEPLPWPMQRDNVLKGAESLARDMSNGRKYFVPVV